MTTDLKDFGSRERNEVIKLFTEWNSNGLPEEFYEDGVEVAFNTDSGFVFLTNEDFQVCMMNGDDLEMFYSCGECGNEGFKEDHDFCTACSNCSECCDCKEDD